jgi:hypothetical protein
MGVRVSDALGGCQVASSKGSAAMRRATLCSAVAGLLLSACADTYHSPAKQVTRSANVSASNSAPRSSGNREVAAARPPAKAPQPTPAVPSDTLFDSRRIEGVGTLLLDDIMPLVRQAPRLRDEVDAALREANTKAQDVICIGRRIDGGWKHLAGARVQPYACKIGARWVEITAELRISGAGGEHYSTVNDIAAQNARTIKETNPRWTWTTTKPREWFLE